MDSMTKKYVQILLRMSIVLLVVIANFCFFFGIPHFDELFQQTIKLGVPDGFSGTIVAAATGKGGAGMHAGMFERKMGDDAWNQISPKFTLYTRMNPAGTAIAYCEGMNDPKQSLCVLDQNRQETKIAAIRGWPVWSPDGESIVCSDLGYHVNGARLPPKGTWKYAKDGSSQTRLPFRTDDIVWDWSPDGRWFLLSRMKDRQQLYFLVDVENVATMLPLEFDEFVIQPRFSRDGKTIICAARAKDTADTVYARELITSDETVSLGPQKVLIYTLKQDLQLEDFAFSANGDYLAMAVIDKRYLLPGKVARGSLQLVKLETGTPIDLSVSGVAYFSSIDVR